MSENPEIFVGIDISKDTLDIGFQPSGQTVQIPHDEPGITEATRRLREVAQLAGAVLALDRVPVVGGHPVPPKGITSL
jgi:hypothetical protein